MPRKFRLYWDKNNKYWFKKFDGKKVYFGKAKSKYLDADGYNEAVAKYEEYLNTQRIKLVKAQRRDVFDREVGHHGERAANTIAGCIDRYYAFQSNRARAKTISYARVKSIRSAMRRFEGWLGKGPHSKTFEPDGIKTELTQVQITGYFHNLQRQVTEGTWIPGTAHQQWVIVLDFLHYCDEKQWINSFPRGLHRLRFNLRAGGRGGHAIKVFSVKQVRDLFAHARDRSVYPVDLWIALALNCGFTSVDIGTLKDEHLVWDSEENNIIKIVKERTKTKQHGEWKLWRSTNDLLKRWLTKRSQAVRGSIEQPEYIFYGRSGRPVNAQVEFPNREAPGSILHRETGYVNDAIGRTFREMIKAHFPMMKGLGFKVFRKSGASEIVKFNLNNTLLIEQLYLAHKPMSVARAFYSRIEANTLDDAIDRLEEEYHLHDLVEAPDTRDERKRQELNTRKRQEAQKRRDRRRNERIHNK